jgi:hypothetical protein
MLQRLAAFLLFFFLAANAVTWPVLPYHAHLADLVFLAFAVTILALPGRGISWRAPDFAVAAYLLGAVPAILISRDQHQSLMELARESYVAAIYVVFAIAVRRGFARAIGDGLALGGALLSIVGLAFIAAHRIGGVSWPLIGEVMTLPYLGDTVRLKVATDSEAMLACVLTASLPFAIERWRLDGARIRGMLATAVTAIAALLTFSHAIAGVAVATLIAAWPSLSNRAIRRLSVAGVIVIVIGFNFAATVAVRSVARGNASYADRSVYHYGVDERSTQVGSTTVTYTVMSYARLKQVAWRTFLESPVAGVGLDQFHTATHRAYEDGSLPSHYSESDPHSSLLGRMAECGAIGAVTLLLLWIAWAMLATSAIRAGSGIGYAAAAAVAGLIVSSLNADIMNFRFLWVVAGLLRGLYEANEIDTASGRAPAGAAGTR